MLWRDAPASGDPCAPTDGRVCEAAVPADALVKAVPPVRYQTVVTAPGAGANPAYDSDAVTRFARSLLGAA